jgi:hypothetical protein
MLAHASLSGRRGSIGGCCSGVRATNQMRMRPSQRPRRSSRRCGGDRGRLTEGSSRRRRTSPSRELRERRGLPSSRCARSAVAPFAGAVFAPTRASRTGRPAPAGAGRGRPRERVRESEIGAKSASAYNRPDSDKLRNWTMQPCTETTRPAEVSRRGPVWCAPCLLNWSFSLFSRSSSSPS